MMDEEIQKAKQVQAKVELKGQQLGFGDWRSGGQEGEKRRDGGEGGWEGDVGGGCGKGRWRRSGWRVWEGGRGREARVACCVVGGWVGGAVWVCVEGKGDVHPLQQRRSASRHRDIGAAVTSSAMNSLRPNFARDDGRCAPPQYLTGCHNAMNN